VESYEDFCKVYDTNAKHILKGTKEKQYLCDLDYCCHKPRF